jgi:hypothetical protein
MHAGLVHGQPGSQSCDRIDRDRRHAGAVQPGDEDERADGAREPEQRHVLGIEDRDERDGDDVVDDRDGQQKQLDPRGDPVAEQREHADGERDVGRGRDGPA